MSRPLLVSASYDQNIRLWDVVTASPVESFAHKESQVNVMQFSPDGCQLAVAGWQHIRIYDIQSCPSAVIATCESLIKNVMSIGFDERSQWMYSGGEDCTAKVWDYRCSLQCQRIFQVTAPVNSVALHPNQVVLVVADSSGALYMWDLRRDTSETLSSFDLDISEYIAHVDVSRTGEHLLAITNRGKILVWTLGPTEASPTNAIILPMDLKAKIAAHSKYGLSCRFAPDSRGFATTAADGYVYLWDCDNITKPSQMLSVDEDAAKTISTSPSLKVEAKWVWDCAYTNDSTKLFTASGCQLRLWDLDKNQVEVHFL
uniref:Target of rapamycin complex subunit lst8 n=1 Tax=Ascaris lumbricoides TaxID=6252 RepID=A0A0M3HNQ7_ASCLU